MNAVQEAWDEKVCGLISLPLLVNDCGSLTYLLRHLTSLLCLRHSYIRYSYCVCVKNGSFNM